MNPASTAMPARLPADWLRADWRLPEGFLAFTTTRIGGESLGLWGDSAGAGGFNLGAHVGDDEQAVARNRSRLRRRLPAEPCWLNQVHGTAVYRATRRDVAALSDNPPPPESTSNRAFQTVGPPTADAAITADAELPLAVLTADCLPVVFVEPAARLVGIAHAGWRGLADGVLESTVAALREQGAQARRLRVWFGPAIGATAFEVGEEVRARFCAQNPQAAVHFVPVAGVKGKWLADISSLARQRLACENVVDCSVTPPCTKQDARRFYSYRRDGITGRMATVVLMQSLSRR